ncbi:MAG: AAA family ATPase [Candidatus Binatia bacterium]
MNWAAFGLSGDPFQRSPELDDACLPNTLAALLSELLSGLRSPQGVSVLVADAGSGKSLAAASFTRRVGGSADVALISQPTSSVSAIARDALAELDPTDFDFAIDEDWVAALRARVQRRAKAGRATAIVLDNAHRLSPQSLEDLAGLFADNPSLRLQVFLFGRPRLLDRMDAGAERALDSHLLRVCRLEPLGVRESVRYLERRLAICGGELAALYSDDAIDEIVQTAGGRILRLEEVAAEALRRATRRGQRRASVEDVVATARRAVNEEEEVMAVHQQPLRFALTDEDAEAGAWHEEGDEEGNERAVEWGDDDNEDEDEWEAEDSEDAEDSGDEDAPALSWDTSPHRLDELDVEEDGEEDYEDAAGAGPAPERRRLVGPAVLSIAAALALVWAANHVPGPSEDVRRGRDARLFAERLSSDPAQIMRLATTVEAADADAQVVAWRAQPPRPVEKASPVRDAGSAAVAGAEIGERPQPKAAAAGAAEAVAKAHEEMGPAEPVAVIARADAAGGAARPGNTVASAAPKPKSAPAAANGRKAVPAKRAATPVFTVQLGAFKARRNAEDLVSKLRGKSPHILQEGGLYRVISGSFANKRDAVVHEASLKRAGYTTYVRTAVF